MQGTHPSDYVAQMKWLRAHRNKGPALLWRGVAELVIAD